MVLNGSNPPTSLGGDGVPRISGDGSMLLRPPTPVSMYCSVSVTDVAPLPQIEGGRAAHVGVTLAVTPSASQLLVVGCK